MTCVGARLCGDTEEALDELRMPYRHVHRFYSFDSSLRRVEGAEALHRSPPSAYGAVVLLDDVVEVLHSTQFAVGG